MTDRKGPEQRQAARQQHGGQADDELCEIQLLSPRHAGGTPARLASPDNRPAAIRAVLGVAGSILGAAHFVVHAVFDPARKATIPSLDTVDHFYSICNILLCPLILQWELATSLKLPAQEDWTLFYMQIPIWLLVIAAALLYYKNSAGGIPQLLVAGVAFLMSILWIAFVATELLGLLSSIGVIVGVSDAILGVTILAWGNSIGDLVTDVAIARAGQPMMAVAGCFAAPLFNLTLGLGIPLIIKTASYYPGPWRFHDDPQVFMVFPVILISVIGSLIVIPASQYKVTKIWGYFLLALYSLFIICSIAVAIAAGA